MLINTKALLIKTSVTVFIFLFNSLYSFAQQKGMLLVPYRVAHRWGLSDLDGNMVLKPNYEKLRSAHYYDQGDFPLTGFFEMETEKKIEVLQNNEVLIPFIQNYDSIAKFPDLLNPIIVYKDGKKGLWYGTKEYLPCEYDSILLSYQNTAYVVMKDNKWGLINYDGKLLIPIKYHDIKGSIVDNFRFEYTATTDGGKSNTYYDKRFNVGFDGYEIIPKVIPPSLSKEEQETRLAKLNKFYDTVEILSDYDLAIVSKFGKKGITTIQQALTTENILKYDHIDVVSRNYAIVKLGEKYGLISRLGVELILVDCNQIIYQQRDGDEAFIYVYGGLMGAFYADPGSKNKHKGFINPIYKNLELVSGISIGGHQKFYLFMATNTEGINFIIDETGKEYYKAKQTETDADADSD